MTVITALNNQYIGSKYHRHSSLNLLLTVRLGKKNHPYTTACNFAVMVYVNKIAVAPGGKCRQK